jgi:hypothetical protein
MNNVVSYATPVAITTLRGKASAALLDRAISDLIIGLDLASDRIQPDDLGGADEAHAAINAAVQFLDGLRE